MPYNLSRSYNLSRDEIFELLDTITDKMSGDEIYLLGAKIAINNVKSEILGRELKKMREY